MEEKIKALVWKLDREIWAHVPDGGQTEPWSTSKAREESSKLISSFANDLLKGELHTTEVDLLKRQVEASKEVIRYYTETTGDISGERRTKALEKWRALISTPTVSKDEAITKN